MLTREEFSRYLRDALNQLYDPDRLCHSPLAGLFGVAKRADSCEALQRILIDAITSLQPEASTPAGARAWRIYELLLFRYVQQNTVERVADQLGLTGRHLRNEQSAAIDALAFRLWERFGLDAKAYDQEQAGAAAPEAELGPTVNDELAWLRNTRPTRPTSLSQTLSTVLDQARYLAARNEVQFKLDIDANLPELSVHQVALSQTLLSLLSMAAARAPGGDVSISARQQGWQIQIDVRCARRPAGHPGPSDDAELDMARQLVDLSSGQLTVAENATDFVASVLLPAPGQLTVLVVDDNADTLQLFERYTAGTGYRLVGTRHPSQALTLAQKIKPQIIVLDVMMPGLDGWRVLAELRQHPLTGHIPVIVCTILPQEDMALSLGASGFARKPINQESFLAALDLQVAAEPGYR